MWTIAISAFLALVFFIIGSLLNRNNARYLLSGYNTLSREEQDQIDLTPYLRFNRRFHYFLAISLPVVVLLLYFPAGNEDAAGIFICLYPILAYTWYTWKMRDFKSVYTNRRALYWVSVVMVLVFAGCILLLYYGFRYDRLTVESGELFIEGIYSERLRSGAIRSLQMTDTLPPISYRSNGFSLATKRKGYYVTEYGEEVKLILNSKRPPYLLVTRNDGLRIFYTADPVTPGTLADSLASLLGKK